MSRPLLLPTWATDANYSAGSDPWSGQPTKSQPSGGKLASGFVPNTDEAAEETNWVLNASGATLAYLDSAISGSNLAVSDEFLGDSINRSIWLNPTGTVTVEEDHTNGALGALKINSTGSGLAYFAVTQRMDIGTADFRVSARVRDTTNGAGAVKVSIGSGTAGRNISFSQANINGVPSHWYAQIATNGAGTDTGVAASSTYQLLEILRLSGVIYFYINGVLKVGPTAFATSMTDNALAIQNSDAGGGAGIMWCDFIKLWVDR